MLYQVENGKLTIPKKRTEPVQEDWKENEAVEAEDEGVRETGRY